MKRLRLYLDTTIWNFRHLANVSRRAKVAALNLEEGYHYPMVIYSPLELLYVE